jgi:hypothetical protein
MNSSLYPFGAFFFLVNDTPVDFLVAPGLETGGPFVSTVVCHCDGSFGRMISAVVSGGLVSGFCVGIWNVGGFDITHRLFANDTLIFFGVDLDRLRHLRCLFLCFEAVSGLKINLVKSELVL